ncbi:MAG TPA: hypothetical protein VFC26_13680, partial [Verrucomicrobiae bacterium]|nr:hypothetical protein [Verrucomicrobiae bacterium]
MPRNGSGTYALVYDWEDDDANDIPIQSDRFMVQEQDIADALTASIAVDGQTPATANLPMATCKHTNVGAATAATDYLRADQLQKGTLNSFTATGTDTYAITPAPVVSAYATYQSWRVLFTNGNTGAATLNVNGLGAKAITKRGTVALVAGDIPAASVCDVVYDGTQFQL